MYKTFSKSNVLNTMLIVMTVLFTNITQANDSKVADEYMKAYATFDLKKMEGFYSENAVFTDPTSEMWGEYAWNMNGRKAIMEKMTSFFSDFDKASAAYNIKEKYESAGHTIYTGKVKFSFVKKGVLETTCMLVTTIISTKEGKVTKHQDYLDYDKYETSKKTGDQNC